MKKISFLFVTMIFLVSMLLTGCSEKAEEKAEGEYDVYYINLNETGLVKESYAAKGTEIKELISELLDAMCDPKEEKEHFSLLGENTSIQEYRYENGNVELNMQEGYGSLPTTREVLVRAGLVRTLVQIDGVESVSILVAGEPLTDGKGQTIGMMNEQSFIENSGKEINSYKSKTLTLYFTNAEGNVLTEESRRLYYSSNVSLEQVIVEQLIKGPRTEICYATLPVETKVMGVTVVDKICYVNFDKTFAESALSVQEQIPIYSIVNSIIENCSVNKVQISIDGESDIIFRETMKLSELYKMNRDLIQMGNE